MDNGFNGFLGTKLKMDCNPSMDGLGKSKWMLDWMDFWSWQSISPVPQVPKFKLIFSNAMPLTASDVERTFTRDQSNNKFVLLM